MDQTGSTRSYLTSTTARCRKERHVPPASAAGSRLLPQPVTLALLEPGPRDTISISAQHDAGVPPPAQLPDEQFGCGSNTDGDSNSNLLLRAVAGQDRRSRPVFRPALGDGPVDRRVRDTKEGGV
eukprot:352922-Chlamydomonas_euryale.AAC.2